MKLILIYVNNFYIEKFFLEIFKGHNSFDNSLQLQNKLYNLLYKFFDLYFFLKSNIKF